MMVSIGYMKHGLITKVGEHEVENIAWRMFNRHKKLFETSNKKMFAAATHKERVKSTRNIFLGSLMKLGVHMDRKVIHYLQEEENSNILRFFEHCEAYKKYKESQKFVDAYEIASKDIGDLCKNFIDKILKD